MSKYYALGAYLSKQFGNEITLTFMEIERITGVKLPPKAQHQPAWWSNNPSNNVMTRVWLDAGFKTEQVSISSRKLVFRRKSGGGPLLYAQTAAISEAEDGMIEGFHEAAGPIGAPAKISGAHPLIGSMAGTFSIEPGYDLTSPLFDADEMADVEANLDQTADLIEQGGAKKQ